LGGRGGPGSRVTSFTIIYICINIQYRAERRAGAACEGSNTNAYQPATAFIGQWCPYKYQLGSPREAVTERNSNNRFIDIGSLDASGIF